MERGKLDKVISMIKGIEKKNVDLEKFLSTNLKILSRKNMLREISYDIIVNNKIFQELQKKDKRMIVGKDTIESISYYNLIEEIILRIQNSPSKKVIYLREFLNKFDEISENDKNVILQSLKDKNIEDLNQEMLSILKIFKAKDL